MLGHLMEWLFNGIGGISQTDSSIAWKEVCINPQRVNSVNHADTSFESPYGGITCNWRQTENLYILEVTIPANSNAIVHLPTADAARAVEYGMPLSEQGLEKIETVNGELLVKVGSGHYHFEVER